jgi:hypothetical protein
MYKRPTRPAPQTDDQAGPDRTKTLTSVAALVGAIATPLTALNAVGLLGGHSAAPTATALPSRSSLPSTTESPTRPPTPSPTSTTMLLEDNFADSDSGWESGADSDAEWGYVDGAYRLAVLTPEITAWANLVERREWDDMTVIAEARPVAGPDDNAYGLIIRYVDRGNFYFFAVASDGHYAVLMLRNDEWYDLASWTPSDVVRLGESTNLLRVECRGPYFRCYVNDKLLADIEDDTFHSGSVGLCASSCDEGGVEVRFDNLLVRPIQGDS